MSFTAKDIAKKMGISAAAVSMALNGKPGVSHETRQRVLKIASEGGFDFSRLKTGSDKPLEIGYIIYRRHNAVLSFSPIFSDITEGIDEGCHAEGHHLHIIQLYEKTDNVDKFISDLRIANYDGLIILGTEIAPETFAKFLELPLPLILLDSYFPAFSCTSVFIDNWQGAYLATCYLLDHYDQQPSYLASSYEIPNFAQRRVGFDMAIREHGLSAINSKVHKLSPSIDGAFSDMLAIIDSGVKLPRSFFADNDLIAIGAMKALKLRGLRIPEDIAIVGFDNINEGYVTEPALTTIDVPRKFMGETAVKELLLKLRGHIPYESRRAVNTLLIKRSSA